MKDKFTILVTGAGGQLGNELRDLSIAYPEHRFVFTGRNELPIDDAGALARYFTEHQPDFCINCAAYTAVDKAESEKENAFRINADAVGEMAAVCRTHHTHFIHISTDYVFDGTATQPIPPDAAVNPVSVYGASKLEGEKLCLQNNPDALIIRTSWVYSAYGSNFVKTMLRLMKERESLNVVSDQNGIPTYAKDLAAAIYQIILNWQSKKRAIYHFSNSGSPISWFDFATAIRDISGSNCTVNPISTAQYPTPAKRPAYSVLDTTDIAADFGITIPHWKESLKDCLNKLLTEQ